MARFLLLLLIISIASNLSMVVVQFRPFRTGPDALSLDLSRYQQVIPHLPASGEIGYLIDPRLLSSEISDKRAPAERFAIAQYALAPRILSATDRPDLILGDFKIPVPQLDRADLHPARQFAGGLVLLERTR